MKQAYLIGVICVAIAVVAYLLFAGPEGYARLEAALHYVPTWAFGEN
jgi:hypothetical protein